MFKTSFCCIEGDLFICMDSILIFGNCWMHFYSMSLIIFQSMQKIAIF